MRWYYTLLLIPGLFLGCGGGESEGGFNPVADYETRTLNFLDIQGVYTIEPDGGLTFSLTPQIADDLYVYLYSNEGNLSFEQTEITGTYVGSLSSFEGSLTLENSATGTPVTFSVANLADTSLSFRIVAWQGGFEALAEGSATAPVSLASGSLYASHVGVLDDSFYTFTKSGNGSATITLKQTGTMTGAAENVVWYLTNQNTEASVSVTDTDGNTSSSCRDAFGDYNVTCSATLANATPYMIRVENNGDAAFLKYEVLVTE